jgi:hypothetical protein
MAEKKKRPGMTIKLPQDFADAIRNASKVSGVSEKRIREMLADKLFAKSTPEMIPMMVHRMVGTQLGLKLSDGPYNELPS